MRFRTIRTYARLRSETHKVTNVAFFRQLQISSQKRGLKQSVLQTPSLKEKLRELATLRVVFFGECSCNSDYLRSRFCILSWLHKQKLSEESYFRSFSLCITPLSNTNCFKLKKTETIFILEFKFTSVIFQTVILRQSLTFQSFLYRALNVVSLVEQS